MMSPIEIDFWEKAFWEVLGRSGDLVMGEDITVAAKRADLALAERNLRVLAE